MEPSVASQALGFAAFAPLVLVILAARAIVRHHNARSAVATPQASAERCQSPLCIEPAQVNLCVGHDDVVRLCIGHGIPLLTEGLRS